MWHRAAAIHAVVALCGAAMGQDPSCIRTTYEWPVGNVWEEGWSTGDTTRTEVLKDDLSIRIHNDKPEFIGFFFERRRVIRFSSEQDILRHGRCVLPESLDPPYDQRNVPFTQRDEPARPKWFNARLDHFAARVVHPDGTWQDLGVLGTTELDPVRIHISWEQAWTYLLDVQGIAPGDVVEIRWKYMVPYDTTRIYTRGWRGWQWMDNWSRLTNWRIFFHGELPIREQRVELLYRKQHGMVLSGLKPTGRSEAKDDMLVVWKHRDLPGCMDEVNARPAMDLPHVVVRFEPQDIRYWNRERLSRISVPFPYWMYVLRVRGGSAYWLQRVSRKHIPDRQNTLVKEFISETTFGMDSLYPARSMELIHDRIAEDFIYVNDLDWYKDIDHSLQRMGDQVAENRFRDISRFDLYAKLIYAHHVDFSTAYLLDKRVGSMNDQLLTPLWDNEFMLAMRDGDGLMWMHPKRGRKGLLANEVPFYWQNTPALIVTLDDLRSDVYPEPVFIDIPGARANENVRTVDVDIQVDLANGTAKATARVLLAGQFSTLTRAVYMGYERDSTIAPVYAHLPQDATSARFISSRVAPVQRQAPYRQAVEVELDLTPGLIGHADSTWSLDLRDLLSHALPEGFDASSRDLDLYWDFVQEDRLAVNVSFDRPVEVHVSGAAVTDHSVSSARLEPEVLIRDNMNFTYSSTLTILGDRVPVAERDRLADLLDAGDQLRDLVLQFRLDREGTTDVGP